MFRPLLWTGLLTSVCGCNAASGWVNNQNGTSHYRVRNYPVALGDFQRAIADDPHNADYAHNLATTMKQVGDAVGAERMYRHALSLDPGHQPSYHGLALLLREQGRETEAVQLLQDWVNTQPYAAGAHVEMAWLQRQQGDLQGAELSLREALRVHPNHPVALAQLGRVYEQTGQTDRAVALYQRSLYNNWYQPAVRSRLAAARSRLALSRLSGRTAIPPDAPRLSRFGNQRRIALPRAYGTTPPSPVRRRPTVAVPRTNADPAHVR